MSDTSLGNLHNAMGYKKTLKALRKLKRAGVKTNILIDRIVRPKFEKRYPGRGMQLCYKLKEDLSSGVAVNKLEGIKSGKGRQGFTNYTHNNAGKPYRLERPQ